MESKLKNNRTFVKLTVDQDRLLNHIDGQLKKLREGSINRIDKLVQQEDQELTFTAQLTPYLAAERTNT